MAALVRNFLFAIAISATPCRQYAFQFVGSAAAASVASWLTIVAVAVVVVVVVIDSRCRGKDVKI